MGAQGPCGRGLGDPACNYCKLGNEWPGLETVYAFDKITGELVWRSTPGTTPQDSSFAPLVFEDLEDGGKWVFA